MKQEHIVRVRDLSIGEGMPKIIVPLTGKMPADLLKQAAQIRKIPGIDAVEWRVDYYEHALWERQVLAALRALRAALGEIPLLFTFRTKGEGGELEIEKEAYYALNLAAARSGLVDLMDVEVFFAEDVADHIAQLQQYEVKVVGSRHDFEKTPSAEEMTAWLERGWEVGADIPKLAVMPQCREDVDRLLAVTRSLREKHDRPLITISMSELGVDSRLRGEEFGSAMTFGAVGQTSAPGQISVADLRRELERIHQNIK